MFGSIDGITMGIISVTLPLGDALACEQNQNPPETLSVNHQY